MYYNYNIIFIKIQLTQYVIITIDNNGNSYYIITVTLVVTIVSSIDVATVTIENVRKL